MFSSLLNGFMISLKYWPYGISIYIIIPLAIIFWIVFNAIKIRRWRTRHMSELQSYERSLNDHETKKHIMAIAQQHIVKRHSHKSMLVRITRFAYANLQIIRHRISRISPSVIPLIPSAKWLFDDYYLIYMQLKELQGASGGNIFRGLPIITEGNGKGYPRIYIIAKEIIASHKRRLHKDHLVSMLDAYQSVRTLTSVELWAFPQIMKLCLLENIIDTSYEILSDVKIKARADKMLKQIIPEVWDSGKFIADYLNVGLSKDNIFNNTFISYIIYHLKEMSVEESEIGRWLIAASGGRITDYKKYISDVIYREGQSQAALETAISSLITSLREVKDLVWEDVFERVSPLEKVLNTDPAGVYEKMDSATKSRYRWPLEKLAAKYRISEDEVAKIAVNLTRRNMKKKIYPQPRHIGTYIIGKGKRDLIYELAGRNLLVDSLRLAYEKFRGSLYFAGIFTIALAIEASAFVLIRLGHSQSIVEVVIFAILLIAPVLGIGIELMNFVFTRSVSPRALPSMDYVDSIPDDARTFIVIPVIIGHIAQAKSYAAKLEKYYLANMQENLCFGILADFKDAPARITDQDAPLHAAAEDAINALNTKYPGKTQRFSLFIRYRKWNESENIWMGWERKRGKLEEFNALLCGENETSYSEILSDRSLFRTFRYVITLDGDTELIRDSAAKLIGIMHHPLNRPVFDVKKNRITDGYVIVQSEIRARVSSAKSCLFSRLFAGQSGIDPYSTVVSDVYQDTFNSAIYVGKGIYDIQMMNSLLRDKIPENSVLSHDLLESCYARTAFASGIKLMDRYPSSMAAYSKREHRWIRGDWQLLPWVFGKHSLGGLSRWKLFDNLRRSLLHVSYLLLIMVNVFFIPEVPWMWIVVVFFLPVFRLVSLIFNVIYQKLKNMLGRIIIGSFLQNLLNQLLQSLFDFTILPFRTYVSIDAISRTIYRLLFSRKKLLEWQTAESVESNIRSTLKGYFRLMWMSMIPGLIMIPASIFFIPGGFKAVGFVAAALWLFSPCIAYYSSIPAKVIISSSLNNSQALTLRHFARVSWQFFEDFSLEKNHWLCPDNYQFSPFSRSSEKTSPTNIGLQLLSTLAARDMGYVGLLYFIDKIEKIMATIQMMPKWNGHLYNWYDVKTLNTLVPEYISTVDSGNFTGYLVTLKNGLIGLQNKPVFPVSCVNGLEDTMKLAGFDNFSDFNECVTIGDWIEELHLITSSLDIPGKPWEDADWRPRLKEHCGEFLDDAAEFAFSGSFMKQKTLNELALSNHVNVCNLIERMDRLVIIIDEIIANIDFETLYDHKRKLFCIGYNAVTQQRDSGFYDLLASEARLTSFLAIAKGDVPQKHWFMLGRPLTLVRGIPTIVSWGGTMFEYLMPNLVMRVYPDTVLSQSCTGAVLRQIKYARRKKIPWGISESQYYRFDTDGNYQYKSFGVPQLSMQSSLHPAMTVAPYATMLALSVMPRKALKNITYLKQLGGEGKYGFYESLDFGIPDSSNARRLSVIKCFMTHHQGMSLISINNVLNNNIMQSRFHREPMVRATEILLEEALPQGVVAMASKGYSINVNSEAVPEEKFEGRYINSVKPKYPCAHVLSNNRYMLMMTSGGEGISSCDDIFLNRWRPDLSREGYGTFIYVSDVTSGKKWSCTYEPMKVEPDDYQVVFSHDKIEYLRKDGPIKTHTAITLSPSDNLEARKVTFTNRGNENVIIETTSYLEVSADYYLTDLYHPAFSKLFIETEYIGDRNLLIAKRRKRNSNDTDRFVMHMVKPDVKLIRNVEYEIDRRNFIGRGRNLSNPVIMETGLALTSKPGFSTDPALILRTSFTVPAGKTAVITYFTGYCTSREDIMKMSYEMSKPFSVDEIFEMSRFSSELELKYLRMNSKQLNAIQNIVGSIYYPYAPFRCSSDIIQRNKIDQSGLWRFGISGDNPIMLVRISSIRDIGVVKDVLLAYEYLRKNHVEIDLVIMNDQEVGYSQELNALLHELTGNLKLPAFEKQKTSLFILQSSQMPPNEIDLLLTVARMIFTEKTGLYYWQFKLIQDAERQSHELPAVTKQKKQAFLKSAVMPVSQPAAANESEELHIDPNIEFQNGIGGFVNDGREYEITLSDGKKTPAPWINVIANKSFGFHISDSGAGYTWSSNSRENKLTSWYNDPVLDPLSEAIYVKDEESGRCSSPSFTGTGDNGVYKIRHGFGYSTFKHDEMDLEQSMTVFAAAEDPIKLWLLSIKNKSGKARELSVYLYVEWVLGVARELTSPYIVSNYDSASGLLTASNIYSNAFREHCAFIFGSEVLTSVSGDKSVFLGADGTVAKPAAITRPLLSGKTGAGLDPCGAIQIKIKLEPGETKETVFGLGQTANFTKAVEIAQKYRSCASVKDELKKVGAYWDDILGRIRVKTPDRALDIMTNGWLLYQTISCRLNARAAFYQCGGAYGFRDQLQDVLALLDIEPDLAKNQILLCCSRQFIEGDVQHWWHSTTGLGIRTRISDDLLWLPYVVSEYIQHTGDFAILGQQANFIIGDELKEDENELMSTPLISDKTATVYEHCLFAIERAGGLGVHGLPLMGGGDWNDGMNRVGIGGKGESVWLGWFIYAVYDKFIPMCEYENDMVSVNSFKKKAADLLGNMEKNAWDGNWYLRAFFDDGTPLGSNHNDECRIDSISQSWSAISGGASKNRVVTALKSANRYLVKEETGVSLLLTPPFDKAPNDPGYIKGYYPGIRENGGQYTHASTWLAIAHAKMKSQVDAYKLLSMMNPINVTSSYKGALNYDKEPYVLSADISMSESNAGEGGWSWYTGSSGWMYQAVVYWLLGINRLGAKIRINPCVPSKFNEYSVRYRYGASFYNIAIKSENESGCYVKSLAIDGQSISGDTFDLIDDGSEHNVAVILSKCPATIGNNQS